MDRIAGKESGQRSVPHRSMRRRNGGTRIAMLCTTWIVLLASEASAQCTARDVLQKRLTLKTAPSANSSPIPVKSAFAAPVWRTITTGTFANSFALLNALDAAGCCIGGSAEEILARPAFTVSTTKTNVELFAVSAAELGFQTSTVRSRKSTHAPDNQVSDLRPQRSLRNSGCNILTSRWASFSLEWSQSRGGRASLSF